MGADRARKRRIRAIEAKYEKTHRRRAQFAPEATPTGNKERRERPDDGLSRDMRKMLSMKRAMEARKRKKAGADVGSGEHPGDGDTPSGAHCGHGEAAVEEVGEQVDARDGGDVLDTRRHGGGSERRQAPGEGKPLSASKQRKKEFMRKKSKGSKGRNIDTKSDAQNDTMIDTKHAPAVAFGEQADAPMKEVLRSRHWAEKPGREGVHPAVSIVGLDARMGTRRVAGMDSQAIAVLYRNQKKKDGEQGGGLGPSPNAARATMKSLKSLVAQGRTGA
jgi:hypothetical protein